MTGCTARGCSRISCTSHTSSSSPLFLAYYQMELDGVLAEQLRALDLDGNGYLTRQEYETFVVALPVTNAHKISI